jgi:ABC-type multidrug transport system permease subunit
VGVVLTVPVTLVVGVTLSTPFTLVAGVVLTVPVTLVAISWYVIFFCGQYVKLSVNVLHSKQIQRKSRSIECNPISLCIVLADIIHTTSMSHVVIEICIFS